ncbi:MAG TPA: hypothetical protein PK468_26290, partial [Candidatus Hydrogenedentes bacterium]|nr:hypothetical protein [Candidatus Hydrogenedentota bacterium]
GPDGVADYPTVWLTAEPFDNCCSKFQRWEVDELDYHDYNEFQNPLQLRMDRDYTVTAEFGPDAADFGADALIVWGGLITSGASQAQSTLTALGYKCTYREEPGTAGALNLIPCHDIFVFQGHSNGLRLIVGCPGATLKDDGQYSYWTFMLQKLYPDDVASVLNNPYRFVYLHACNPEGVPALEAWRDAFQAEALVGWINPASEGEGEGEGEEGVDFGLLMAFDEAFWEYVQEGWGTWDATYKAMAKANIHDTDLKRPQPIGDVVLKK